MKRFTFLDATVAAVGCSAIGLVIYLKINQGRLYLEELLMMGLGIASYSRYRTTRKKEPIQPPETTRGK
jgi:hypothetical protein